MTGFCSFPSKVIKQEQKKKTLVVFLLQVTIFFGFSSVFEKASALAQVDGHRDPCGQAAARGVDGFGPRKGYWVKEKDFVVDGSIFPLTNSLFLKKCFFCGYSSFLTHSHLCF